MLRCPRCNGNVFIDADGAACLMCSKTWSRPVTDYRWDADIRAVKERRGVQLELDATA